MGLVNKIFVMFVSCVFLMGCENSSGFKTLDASNSSLHYSKSCQIIGLNILKDIIKNALLIPSGDVPMLDENGMPFQSSNCKLYSTTPGTQKNCTYLDTYQKQLKDVSCDASGIKILNEVLINACSESLSYKENQDHLFPQGSRIYKTIYQTFVGRTPKADEIEVLDSIIGSSEEERMVKVCSVITNSIASLAIY